MVSQSLFEFTGLQELEQLDILGSGSGVILDAILGGYFCPVVLRDVCFPD